MIEHKIYFFSKVANSNKFTTWKSKKLSDESIKPPSTSNNGLNPGMNYINNGKVRVKFDGHHYKLDKVTFTLKAVLDFYIVYEIKFWLLNLHSRFALLNSLFGPVNLTKNSDPNKSSYSG